MGQRLINRNVSGVLEAHLLLNKQQVGALEDVVDARCSPVVTIPVDMSTVLGYLKAVSFVELIKLWIVIPVRTRN